MWDWFVPTTNFTSRAEVMTLTLISTLLVIGASSTLRTRSVVAGIVSTGSAVLGAAIINAAACGLVYWNWRSPELITAVNGSGGLEEVFTLPIMTIVPGTMIGAIGAYVVSLLRTCHPQS